MSDILNLRVFDGNLNACYSAGYHDGAFPRETPQGARFEAVREEMLKHNAALIGEGFVCPKSDTHDVLRLLSMDSAYWWCRTCHAGHAEAVAVEVGP